MEKTKGHSPLSVANFFILERKEEKGISLMKLIKLCYFAHGFVLAITDKRIFINEYAEAWKYGPVFPSIFHEFKAQIRIKKPATRFNPETQQIDYWETNFDQEEQSILYMVNDSYGELSAVQLSNFTHRKGSAWNKAWEQGEHIRGFSISNDSIKEEFKEIIDKKRS